MKLRRSLIAVTTFTLIAAPAHAFSSGQVTESGQFTIGITGVVPIICRTSVSGDTATSTGGTVQLGTLNNFCNSPSGYEVVADYSPNLAGASMIIDGKAILLQNDGSTVVSSSDTPSIDSHSISLDLAADQPADGSISFRIQPL